MLIFFKAGNLRASWQATASAAGLGLSAGQASDERKLTVFLLDFNIPGVSDLVRADA